MTDWTDAVGLIDERENASRGIAARYAPGAVAFALSAALGVYIVYFRAPVELPAPTPEFAKPQVNAFGGLEPVIPPPSIALQRKSSSPFGGLVTTGFGSRARFAIAEAPAPLPPVAPPDLRRQTDDEGVPLPPRRPSTLARPTDPAPAALARVEEKPTEATAPASGPGIFEKLFGGSTTAPKAAPSPTLAYAAPPPVASPGVGAALVGRSGGAGSPGGFGGFLRGLNMGTNPASRYGERVAVYDISARVVYMPDGTKLEAHSGLGSMRDDPSSVSTRMKGATPPATYSLTVRESLFHGVEALRLTPLDSNVYGRAGLLAHTYMLGPDGDSNGCISFRDYDAFLRAYRAGQVSKLVVVTRL